MQIKKSKEIQDSTIQMSKTTEIDLNKCFLKKDKIENILESPKETSKPLQIPEKKVKCLLIFY